jgi:hypothetical protein
MPSFLLDKSVARRIVEALYHLDDLSPEEELVLGLWRQLQVERARLFIPVGALHILQRFEQLIEVRTFLATVEPLESSRYLKRWARRLREYNFTREDALVLALATYGTDSEGDILGVEALITLDQPFLNNFQAHRAELQSRLAAMTNGLPEPYSNARLPVVRHPEELVHSAPAHFHL